MRGDQRLRVPAIARPPSPHPLPSGPPSSGQPPPRASRRAALAIAAALAPGLAPAAELVTAALPAPPAGPPPAACAPITTPTSGAVTLTRTFRDGFGRFDPYGGPWVPHYAHNDYDDWRARTLTGNGEAQIYVDPRYRGSATEPLGLDPFRLAGGVLRLTAQPAPEAAKPYLHGYEYTSGMISSRNGFTQAYGYFEIRAKLPAGQGLWPAFWLLRPGQWPPEIDVMEYLGSRPGGIELHAHWSEDGTHRSSGCRVALADATTRFHRYGVLWQPDALTWYIDRRPVAWIAAKPGMDQPMYLLANLGVGGTWGGPPDETTPFPATYAIDTITAWRVGE